MNGEPKNGWTIDSSTYGLVGLGLVLGLLAVSGDSYWIDEASTLDKAIRPTVLAWWERLRWEANSNLQLPLYLLYAWGWNKLFGAGEWAMRAANIPWFLLAVVSWSRLFGGPARMAASAGLLLSAFAWFYVNEARPYAMQLGAACAVFATLVQFSRRGDLPGAPERARVWMLAIGCVVLSASGMLAMLWLGGGLLSFLFANPWSRTKKLLSDHWPIWAGTAVLLLGVGGYYLWTLTLHARATTIARTDLKSLLFTLYEMFGFLGLGPSRLALRTGGLAGFKPFAPGLVVYGLLGVGLLGLGWRRLCSAASRRSLLWVGVGCGSVAAFLIVVGLTSRFRVLGRHCMPLLPVLLYPLGLGLAAAWEERGRLGKLALTGFTLLSLGSCLELRFDPRHARDAYRGAAALARAALEKGQRVWWNGDSEAAALYGVPLADKAAGREWVLWVQPDRKGFEVGLEFPDLVLASKPDVYDGQGWLAEFLRRSGFHQAGTLPAFTIWRKKE